MREKLIELIRAVQYQGNAVHGYHDKYVQNSELADHLIANGVTIQKWIPVTERLPDKHGKPYVCLLTFPQGGQFPYILNWYEYGDNGYVKGRHFQDEGLDGMKVTHWMPLPEPPKGE